MADTAKSATVVPVSVLVIGPNELTSDILLTFRPAIEVAELSSNIEVLLEVIEPPPSVIICSVPPQAADATEIGQLLSSQYTGIPLFLVATKESKLNRKILLKNGYTDIFFFPVDKAIFQSSMEDIVSKAGKRGKAFKTIKVMDVEPDTTLSFDTYIYLSANNKHIKYSAAGDSLPKERAEKLKSHDIGALYIAGKDYQKFYDYTASRLKDLQGDNKLSETERSEKMSSAVRDLFGNLFSEGSDSIDSGKGLVNEGQKIIKSYILQNTGKDVYERILTIAANNADFYSHASNVSSYATLFAMGLGLKNVSEIAMAGLLHDLGLAKIPDDILSKEPEIWTPTERELYEKHVDYTNDVIREKKLILSDLTRKIIYQHHEKFNGMGYPKGLSGDRICIEAQILALADRFDYMTVLKPGRPRVSPKEAINQLIAESSVASKMDFDPKLIKKIRALF